MAETGSNQVTGGAVISRTLRQLGIHTVFSLAGTAHTHLLDALDRDEFSIVPSRHETATVAAADGYARVTGKLGVALVIADQGMVNAIAGIQNALEACSPVLVLVARPFRPKIDPEYEIDHDALALVRPVTKWARQVHDGRRLREHVLVAYRHATSGRPGPVVLLIPREFLQEVFAATAELDSPIPGTVRPAPAPESIDAAIDLLRQAKRPVVLASNGAKRSGAGEALRRFADTTGVPVLMNGEARGLVPEDHVLGFPWFMANKEVHRADLVIWAGARMNQHKGFGLHPAFARDCRFIQIDIEEAEIGRNRHVEVGIVSDLRVALEVLSARAEGIGIKASAEWLKAALVPRMDRLAELSGAEQDAIHPLRLAREVQDRLPENAIFVGDGAEVLGWANAVIRVKAAGGYIDHYPMGSMGIGTAMALGVAAGAAECARLENMPVRPVVHFTGDGSFGYYASELSSADLAGLKLTIVVGNDRAWGTERHGHVKDIGRPVNTLLGTAHYELIAKCYGGGGEAVVRHEELGPALDRALASDKSYVVNVFIDENAGAVLKGEPLLTSFFGSDLTDFRRQHFNH